MGEAAAAPSVRTAFGGPAPGQRRRAIKRRRVLIGDSRGNGRYLRATWHAEGQMFVLSTWTDEVCTGAVRIPVEKASDLVNLLSDGMGDAIAGEALPAAAAKPSRKTPSTTAASVQRQLTEAKGRFLRWWREPAK